MEQTNRAQSRTLFWGLSLGTMVLALLVHLSSMLLLRHRLPAPLATHWNGAGIADGTGSFAAHLWLGVGTLVFMGLIIPLSAMVKPSGSKNSGQPILIGLGNGLLIAITGLLLSGTVGQLDEPQALGTTMNVPTLVAGLVLGLGWGIFSAMWLRKATTAQQNAEEENNVHDEREKTVQTSGGAMPANHVTVPPGTRISSSINSPLWLNLLLLGTSALSVYLVFSTDMGSPLAWFVTVPGLLILVLASLLLISGKVVADDEGIRVYGGGILKLMHVRPAKIKNAQAREIRPMDYGGWGLRLSGAGVAFITGTGPGVVVTQTEGADRIYSVATMDDAQAMAAILNRLATQNTTPTS